MYILSRAYAQPMYNIRFYYYTYSYIILTLILYNKQADTTVGGQAEGADLVSIFVGSLRSDRPDGLFTTVGTSYAIIIILCYTNTILIYWS